MKSNHALRCGLILLSTQLLAGCTACKDCNTRPAGSGNAPASQPAVQSKANGPTTTTQNPQAAGESLFDGKSLGPWKSSDYAGAGEPRVENGSLILPVGERLTGVTYTGELPKINYEITFDARRVDGTDFFVGLTFPVGDSPASLIYGGWGGTVCGISSLDGEDAAHNDTRSFHSFTTGTWYHVRLRVTAAKLEAWSDQEKIVDVSITGKKLSIRPEIEESKPLGLASFATTAEIKNIRLTKTAP